MTATDPTLDVLVVGIGPSLRGDDSAGPQAVGRWQARRASKGPASVRAICLEAPGLSLLDVLEAARRVVIVDAVRSGAAPGTLHRISPDVLAAFGADSRSAHGWGVGETLALARLVCPERLPESLCIIGIEVDSVQPGSGLSPAVAAALDGAADMIEAYVREALRVTCHDSSLRQISGTLETASSPQ